MSRILVLSSLALVIACDDWPRETPNPERPSDPVATEPADFRFDPPPTQIYAPPEEETGAPAHADLPFLVSRFAPHQGLGGTLITFLTAFDPSGCAAELTCSVTVGGVSATIENDHGLLEAVVPEWAESGPVCVTVGDRTECPGPFRVMTAPELYWVSPDEIPPGAVDTTLAVRGDGFAPDAEVWFGGQPVETVVHSQRQLGALVPAALLTTGEHELLVYSASTGRCGAASDVVIVRVN